MMNRVAVWSRAAAGAAVAVCVGSSAWAQPVVITQWNFNNAPAGCGVAPPPNSCIAPPSTGSGTMTLIGTAQAANSGAYASQTGSGPGSSDPNTGQAYNTSNYPPQGTASGTAGIEFAVSTANFTNIQFLYDARASGGASRYLKVQYSNDGGSNWIDAPNGVFLNNNTNWTQANTVDLSSDSAAGQNPNFHVRIVTIFSPVDFTANSIFYPANTAYQPSGTSLTSAYISGQTDSPNFGGTIRWDMVTVRGTPLLPTPPVIGLTGASPAAVCQGGASLLTVPVAPGANPVSSDIAVTVDLTQVGGSASQAMTDDGPGGVNGDLVAGDGIYSCSVTTAANSSTGSLSLPVHVVDGQGRNAGGTVTLGVGNCNAPASSSMVISSVYGGGGNTGASLNADYVELFNRGQHPVDITGWSVQYASSTGVGGFTDINGVVALSGIVQPGHYVLVQMSAPGAVGDPLPTPDFFAAAPPFSGMGGSAGRVALVSSTTPIGTSYTDPSVKDLVGYGTGTISFEGVGPTSTLGNDLAAVRKNSGCQDTNQNFNDFDVLGPGPRSSASTASVCPPPPCPADFDHNGHIEPSDIASFVNTWFSSLTNHTLDGDFDGNGVIEPSDIAGFVNTWFNALSSGGC